MVKTDTHLGLGGGNMRDRGKTLEMYGGGEELGSHCRKHPSQASGGICALCLKDKLSKLVCSDCGEQRPPSCSCSEAASSSSNNKDPTKAGTVDVGSAGRISFLIESDSGADLRAGEGEGGGEQLQCDVKSRPDKPDAIVLLKRSKSVACTASSTRTPPPSTPPPAQSSSSLSASGLGDSKVCAPDTNIKRPSSSFWSFLYFGKSRSTPTKNNNKKTSDQSKHNVVGSYSPAEQGLRPPKEEVACRQQEVLCARPSKKELASGKPREAGLVDFVDEVSPRPTSHGVVNRKPEEETPSNQSWNVHESPLWIFPKLFRSRSVGCGRNSFSVDQDDTSLKRLESGLKAEPKGHIRSSGDERKSAMTKSKSKQSSYRSPRSSAAARTGHMKIDKEEEQSRARGQSNGKPKGLFGGFGKSGATLHSVSSVGSEGVASTTRNKGWSWAFSSPARIFKHSYHRKSSREVIRNNTNGFMNHDKRNASTSNSADAALHGD